MTEDKKIRYRNICRETHLMQCDKDGCSEPLGHSPFEVETMSDITDSDNFPEIPGNSNEVL